MYDTEGVSAIATVTELRMETGDLLKLLDQVPVICIQRNNAPEAAMLSMETYKAVRTQLEEKGTSLEEL
jgi:PHD/YefM family antitoxin component YafN of YafNO toxin-antitoxin module